MADKSDSKKKLSDDVKTQVKGQLDKSTKGDDIAYACGPNAVFKCKDGGYDCEYPDECANVYEVIT